MARPTSLTPDVHAKIVRLVGHGNFRETAAAAAGVTSRTLRSWLERGAQGEEPFATFADDVERAEAEAETKDIALIVRAGLGDPSVPGSGDWKAIAWRRERMSVRWRTRVAADVNVVGVEVQATPQMAQRLVREAFGQVTPGVDASSADDAEEGPSGE